MLLTCMKLICSCFKRQRTNEKGVTHRQDFYVAGCQEREREVTKSNWFMDSINAILNDPICFSIRLRMANNKHPTTRFFFLFLLVVYTLSNSYFVCVCVTTEECSPVERLVGDRWLYSLRLSPLVAVEVSKVVAT